MGETVSVGLLGEMRRLLELAGADEQAATAGFDTLSRHYGRDELADAVLTVASEFLGSAGLSGTERACLRTIAGPA